MPIPIAKFISEKVYEGRLLSEHKIDLPDCLAFIDVPRTGERPAGTSTEVMSSTLPPLFPYLTVDWKEFG